jgi:hypothetical protein
MSYIEKKFFKEGQNETSNQIDVFKNKSTGDLMFRDPLGEEILITPQGGLAPIINNLPTGPAYKVYTALLTQSGGDNEIEVTFGMTLEIGVTYYILSNGGDFDLTIFGAPNSQVGTYFVCTTEGTCPDGVFFTYNTGAPKVTVLENTIGNIWFDYEDVGVYGCRSNDLFTTDKTFLLLTNPNIGNGVVATANYIDINSMAIVFYDNASPYETLDNALENTPIEIRVYN